MGPPSDSASASAASGWVARRNAASCTRSTQFTVVVVELPPFHPTPPCLSRCPAQNSGQLVRPRPARHHGQRLDQPKILIRPYIGGIVEQRDEGQRFRPGCKVIQIVPRRQHTSRTRTTNAAILTLADVRVDVAIGGLLRRPKRVNSSKGRPDWKSEEEHYALQR